MVPSVFLITTRPLRTVESIKDPPTILATRIKSVEKLFLFFGSAIMQDSATNLQNCAEC
jgi:hypothetical protein